MIDKILGLISVILLIVALFLHSVGLHLLRCLHMKGRIEVQHIYIMNLSAVEVFTTILFLIQTLIDLIDSIDVVVEYTNILLLTICSLVMYLNMMYIVLDKALEVYWNMKYPLYMNTKKAKYLELITWILGVFMCIGIVVPFNVLMDFRYSYPLVTYFRPTLDVTVLFIVIVCYTYIFCRYRATVVETYKVRMRLHTFDEAVSNSEGVQEQHKSEGVQVRYKNEKASTDTDSNRNKVVQDRVRHSENTINAGPTKIQSLFKTFINSRFIVSVCLVTTYVLFVVIPDLILLLWKGEKDDETIQNLVSTILFSISYISDACIYILLDVKVKRLMERKFHVCHRTPSESDEELWRSCTEKLTIIFVMRSEGGGTIMNLTLSVP